MKSYTITVNGVPYEVTVEEKSDNVNSSTAMITSPVNHINQFSTKANDKPVQDEGQKPAKDAVTTVPKQINQSSGDKKIEAPMPGKILAIKASVGQTLKRGDVLFILEAMKLENEIVAPEDGMLASIHVSSGDVIESGVILATFN